MNKTSPIPFSSPMVCLFVCCCFAVVVCCFASLIARLYTYICDWPHRSKLQMVQAREGFLSCAFRPSTPIARTSCPQRACPAVPRQCPPANAREAPSLRRRKPSLPLLTLMVARQRPPRHPQPGMLWSSRRPRLTCIPIPRFKSKIC